MSRSHDLNPTPEPQNVALDSEIDRLRARVSDLEGQLQRARGESGGEPDLLRIMAEGTSRAFGAEFFRAFVKNVAELFRVRHVLITEMLPNEPTHVRTLAHWKVNQFGDQFEYDVRWCPCEAVVRGEPAYHASRVRELFPRDRNLVEMNAESYCGVPLVTSGGNMVGHFAVIDDRPMEQPIFELSLVQIHLARAAAELERKQVEEQLRVHRDELAHVSRASTLGELAAGIAHELNQPLAAIANYTSAAIGMLRADGPPPLDDLIEVLEGADGSAIRASEIVKRLRALVGRQSVQDDIVDLSVLAEETVGLIRAELDSQKVTIALDLEPELPLVTADRIQIQQVLLNLLRNAREAVAENDLDDRKITLRIRSIEERIEVTVRDRGVGLDPSILDRIFDQFFTTKSDGMGMGLSISRSIIESHGGRLWAVPNPDVGMSFHFTLLGDRSRS